MQMLMQLRKTRSHMLYFKGVLRDALGMQVECMCVQKIFSPHTYLRGKQLEELLRPLARSFIAATSSSLSRNVLREE